MTTRNALAALAISMLPILAMGGLAHADTGAQDITLSNAQCTKTADTNRSATVYHLMQGALVTPTGRTDSDYGSVRISTSNGPCWVSDGAVSSPIGGPLDPSAWHRMLLHPDPENSALITADVAGGLFGASGKVRSAPSRDAQTLGEIDSDDFIEAAPWSVQATTGFLGQTPWTPVNWNGTVGWVEQDAFVEIPTVVPASLTASITPARDVSVYALPAGSSDAVDSISGGTTVSGAAIAWNGYLAVKRSDGTVGYVKQADLAEPTPQDRASVSTSGNATATATASPGLGDRIKGDYAKWKTAHKEQKAAVVASGDNRSVWQKMKDGVTGKNPVARAAAKGRLYVAGSLGLLAILLAGTVVSTTKSASRLSRKSLAADLVSGGIKPLIVHGSMAAAPVAGLASAYLLPRHYFVPQSIGIGVLVGGAVAIAMANRTTTLRSASSALEAAKKSSTMLLLAGGGSGALAAYATGGGLVVAIVIGMTVAGIGAGIAAPKATPEPGGPIAMPTSTPVPEPEMEHLT